MYETEILEGRRVPLVELHYSKFEVMENEDGPAKISGIISVCNQKNLNGRVYTTEVMSAAVSKIVNELDRHPGFVDHPAGTPSVGDIGIRWTQLYMAGNLLRGEGEIVPTQRGQDLLRCIEAGIEVGISTRGFGNASPGKWQGEDAVLIASFDLDGADAVVFPSNVDARFEVEGLDGIDYSAFSIKQLQTKRPEFIEALLQVLTERLQSQGLKDMDNDIKEQELKTEEPSVLTARIRTIEGDGLTTDDLRSQYPELVDAIETEILESNLLDARWTAKFISSLPNAAFAVITKSGDRKLPHHDASVVKGTEKDSVDLPHLRNALARVSQMTGVTDAEREKAQKHLDMHKKQFGLSDSLDTKDTTIMEDNTEDTAQVNNEDAAQAADTSLVEDKEVVNPLQEQLNEATAKFEAVTAELTEAKAKVESMTARLDESANKIAEFSNLLAEKVARIVEVEAEKQALAEDAKNVQSMVDLMAKEVGDRAKSKDFYGAARMSMMGDTMMGMMSGDMQPSMDSLVTAIDTALESLAAQNIQNLIRERCRPERYSHPLADALIAQCKTKEEVDSRFAELKAKVESQQVVTRPTTRGEVNDKERTLSPTEQAALERMREMHEHR